MTAVGTQVREVVKDLDSRRIPKFDPMNGQKLTLKQRIDLDRATAKYEPLVAKVMTPTNSTPDNKGNV